MWFVFGLFTLVGSIVLVYRHRREDKWVGTAYGRIHVEERRNPKTGKVIQLWSRIDADPALDFELKRETWLDRLAKALRLSNEAQVGRPPFDRLCYVVSDDPAIRARLRAEPAFTERLRELVEIRGDYHFHRLVCRNGRLRVDFKPAREDPQLFDMVSRLQTHLQGLAALAPSSPSRHRARDPYLGRSLFLLALSSGLAVSGFVQAIRVALFDLPFCVDVGALWAYALPVAALLDDDEEISEHLRAAAEAYGLAWTGDRRSPEHLALTVVVRPGFAVLGPNEGVWFKGWRYANHLQSLHTGELVLVTEHGWVDFMTEACGHEPRMVA